MPSTETHHANAEALAAAVAERIGGVLDQALALRGRAVMALAGGRTAPPIFKRLVAQARDWSALTLLPSDERWVAADHQDNNLRQMREGFAAVQSQVHWLPLAPSTVDGPVHAQFAQTELDSIEQDFDLCLLGMGADGHFASLFPGAANLSDALALNNPASAVAIVPDPMPSAGGHPRISLTLSRLLRSRALLLAICGADKLQVLRRAQAGADPLVLPIAALLSNPKVLVEIHWSP
jgi:6-phosphogluconolactonase